MGPGRIRLHVLRLLPNVRKGRVGVLLMKPRMVIALFVSLLLLSGPAYAGPAREFQEWCESDELSEPAAESREILLKALGETDCKKAFEKITTVKVLPL